jgi:hypothetical protein
MLEGIFELIFRIIFNSIGAAIRWAFFLGKYSYKKLFLQETRNITVAILALIMFIAGGIYLNENSKKDIEEQGEKS